MQVPNSDFYNISVGGAHKGFSKSSSVPHYPSSSHQITDFFMSTLQHNLGRSSLRCIQKIHACLVHWYKGCLLKDNPIPTLYLASFIFNDNLIASMKRCCQWQSIAYIFLAWNLSSFDKEVTNKKKYKLLFDLNFTYDVLFPSFFSKKCIQFIYFMILGVILVASLQEIFVVAVRNEDTIRWFLCGFFLLFHNMSLLLVVEI